MNMWKKAVNRHGAKEALQVPFCPSIRFAHDEDFCQTLDYDLRAIGSSWEIRKATKSLWKLLPDEKGIYMFIWKLDGLPFYHDKSIKHEFTFCTYVGQAGANNSNNTLKTRYKQEYSKYLEAMPDDFWADQLPDDRKTKLKLILTMSPIYYWFLSISDDAKILNLESRLIQLLRPPGNSVGRRVLKPRTPVQAFRSY